MAEGTSTPLYTVTVETPGGTSSCISSAKHLDKRLTKIGDELTGGMFVQMTLLSEIVDDGDGTQQWPTSIIRNYGTPGAPGNATVTVTVARYTYGTSARDMQLTLNGQVVSRTGYTGHIAAFIAEAAAEAWGITADGVKVETRPGNDTVLIDTMVQVTQIAYHPLRYFAHAHLVVAPAATA
jgi:hypothetical protein